ncbi:hypothetical protein [Streptomyces hydrogenans]|uniref:hypothetical protein n=1 Tax=Streptomyces hydrogenans TaxID=1873719 RepID=UPI003804EA43
MSTPGPGQGRETAVAPGRRHATKEHVRGSPDFESGQNEHDVTFVRLVEQYFRLFEQYYANRHM